MAKQRRKKGRDISGILLLDKPQDMTSNKALQEVKHLFDAQKAGHTGSLDPIATGLLPICFGEATKISGFLLTADKSYVASVQLGVSTTSGDREGEVVERRPIEGITPQKIQQVLERFTGVIEQVPPMHSAIKKNGIPLYKLARQGVEVERQPRTVTIHELHMLDFTDDCLRLSVSCSKGTYIRTLAEDIGEALGCGANVSELRRLTVGPFTAEKMMNMAQLRDLERSGVEALDAVLLPIEEALLQWPEVSLSNDSVFYIKQGQAVFVPKMKESGFVRLYSQNRQFLGIGHILEDGRVAPKRLLKNIKIG